MSAAGMSLGAFAENFASARQMRLDREEREKSAARQDRWLDIMERNAGMPQGGMGAMPGTAAPTGATGSSLLDSLVNSESGGNWNALNDEGYGGRLQFGTARLADAAAAGLVPAGTDGKAFSQMLPAQQKAVENWHFADLDKQAEKRGLSSYVGQNVGGVLITQDGIRAMAHLGGMGGASKFLKTGGKYNPADSNGTTLSSYAARHGGMGATRPAY